MDDLAMKKEWILNEERRFARDLACSVIDVPKMSMWMILIPFILVYHVHRHNNAVKGRSAFVDHYLLSRSRSLEEACRAQVEQRPANVDSVAVKAVDLPEAARSAYRDWITVLIQHYADLLQASGADYRELIVAAYRHRTNYLLLLNQLNHLEKALNAALRNHVADSAQSVTDTIARLEVRSAELRRLQAETLFP